MAVAIYLVASTASALTVENLKGSISLEEAPSVGLELTPFGEDETHVSLRIDAREFQNCSIENANLSVRDSSGQEVVNSRLKQVSGRYFFRISKEFLESSQIRLGCELNKSAGSRDSYLVELKELL